MTAAKRAKTFGLKSLKQVADCTGQSLQTLTNWNNNENKQMLFDCVCQGTVKILNDQDSSKRTRKKRTAKKESDNKE